MKTPGMILLVAALFTARGMQAQDKVRITLVPPEGGTVKTIPPLPSDGMVERGSTLTLQATPAKGRMLDCIFAAADGPWRYYNECCALESLLTCDRDYEVGASFLPAKTFSKIRVTNNVVYAQPGKKTLKYDVFAPRGAKRLPIVVIVHGGGWNSNTEDIMRGMGRELAMTGKYVAVSIDYRFLGNRDGDETPVDMYQIVEDVYGAIAHIMEHAAQYGGDGSRLFVTGDSAGGHLSASAINFADYIGGGFGSKAGVYEFRPTYIPKGKTVTQLRREICSALLGAVPTYPVLTENVFRLFYQNDSLKAQNVIPIMRIPQASAREVPQLIIRGTRDQLIRDQDMQLYIAAMENAGQQVKYLQIAGIGHAFFDWRHDRNSQKTFDRFARPQIRVMVAFFDDILARRAKR